MLPEPIVVAIAVCVVAFVVVAGLFVFYQFDFMAHNHLAVS